jgi:hypothetical protein
MFEDTGSVSSDGNVAGAEWDEIVKYEHERY